MKRKNKSEKLKRILAIVCAGMVALAIVASVVLPVMAATQTQIDAAKQKSEQAKKDKQNAEAKHKTILEEYKSLDKQISNTENEIKKLEESITATQKDIETKQAELVEAEAEYALYKGLFLSRARVMYENSDVKYFEILFGAKNFSDFLSKIEMISLLMEYDRNILNRMNETMKTIAETKEALENYLITLEDGMVSLEGKRASLNTAIEQKKVLLDDAAKDVEKYKQIYEAAEAEEQRLINSNKNAFDASGNSKKYTGGAFQWPVPGSHRVTSHYGYRIHPVYKTKKFHTGIDIGAGYGLDIVAAADGVVTLATTNGGYGKCIVINHGTKNGKAITTLYGHCSTLLVSNGATVKKGQVIAKVGSTGVSTGPHLHFEVRLNGSTIDPDEYL